MCIQKGAVARKSVRQLLLVCQKLKYLFSFGSKILLHQFHNGSRQQEHRDQVRDRHQPIKGLCDTPQKSKFHGSTKNRYQRIHMLPVQNSRYQDLLLYMAVGFLFLQPLRCVVSLFLQSSDGDCMEQDVSSFCFPVRRS